MIRFLYLVLLTTFLMATLAEAAEVSGLRQTHPAKLAPSRINNGGGDFNEYPWFSYDGKLMFWTREDPAGSAQKLFLIYLQNRDQVAATPEGTGIHLPDLVVGRYTKLDAVNDWVRDTFVEDPGDPEVELRALAICHEPGEELPLDQPAQNRLRYRFSLYFSARAPGNPDPGTLWRAHNLIADVNKSNFDITIRSNGLTFDEVVPQTNHPVNPAIIANETEPAFSRDSRFFFWASNAWGGSGNEAEYIGPTTQCQQLMQNPKPYSTLPTSGPGSYFKWKDQYAETSRTNYHTLIEMHTGRTALIFEECHAKNGGTARDDFCKANSDAFSTTGFTANGRPCNIVDSGWWFSGRNIHRGRNLRATHPAVSGGQYLGDGSWLFFYMQERKIYYTKLKQTQVDCTS